MSEGVPDHPRRRHAVVAVDRRHVILERVAEEQTIHVGELAREFDVSEMTIRRDIRRLERDGFLRQTYGGATAHLTRSLDVAFNARALQHAREKRLIGMHATRLLADARLVYVGIGTTAEQFARYLPAKPDLTVVTGSLTIASLLGTRPIRIVVLGGTVMRDELTCVGPVAAATLERFRFDLAVIGAAGLSARWGITEISDAEAEVQRVVIERAQRIIVIADGTKLGLDMAAVVAPAARISTLVTDRAASPAELAALRDLGVEVIIADQRPAGTQRDAPEADNRSGARRQRRGAADMLTVDQSAVT